MLAMHRDGLVVLPPPRGRHHRPKPVDLRAGHRAAAASGDRGCNPRRGSRRSTCAPSSARPARAGCGTSSSPVTTLSRLQDPRRRPACATPSTTETAGPSPCSASQPPHGSSLRATHFIGWTPRSREKNLPLVVDNPRFLILPWITIPNLGSHILALIRQRLPLDWAERYNTTPVLIETFVETPEIHRRRIQGIGLDPCRNHPGAVVIA